MRLEVSSQRFNESLRYASQFSNQRVYSGAVRCTIGNGLMSFSGCDGTLWASSKFPATSQENAEFAVDPFALAALPQNNSILMLNYNHSNGRLLVNWGDGKMSFQTRDASDWPYELVTDFGDPAPINGNFLKDGLDAVMPARMNKGTGVLWENVFLESDKDDEWLSVFATDTVRLHRYGVSECCDHVRIQLIPSAVKAIQSMPLDDDDILDIYSNGTAIKVVSTNGYDLIAKVPYFEWPNIKGKFTSIPEGSKDLTVDSKYIQAATTRAGYTRDADLVCQLRTGASESAGRLFFECNSINPPFSIQENMPFDGEGIDVKLMPKYLADAIKCADSDRIKIVKKEPRGYVVVTNILGPTSKLHDGPGFTAVIAGHM